MYEIKPCPEDRKEEIHAGLRAYNRRFCADVSDLSCLVEDGEGRCLAGCDAFRFGELAVVDILWVDEGCRGRGLGARILTRVEEEATRQGARRLELNTFGFQAPGFYEKLGYRRFGAVDPAVGEYGHYYYVKEF